MVFQERIALRKAFAQCRFPAAGYKPTVSIGETYELEGVDPTDSVVASFHRAKFDEVRETIRERVRLFR